MPRWSLGLIIQESDATRCLPQRVLSALTWKRILGPSLLHLTKPQNSRTDAMRTVVAVVKCFSQSQLLDPWHSTDLNPRGIISGPPFDPQFPYCWAWRKMDRQSGSMTYWLLPWQFQATGHQVAVVRSSAHALILSPTVNAERYRAGAI